MRRMATQQFHDPGRRKVCSFPFPESCFCSYANCGIKGLHRCNDFVGAIHEDHVRSYSTASGSLPTTTTWVCAPLGRSIQRRRLSRVIAGYRTWHYVPRLFIAPILRDVRPLCFNYFSGSIREGIQGTCGVRTCS